jgi:integrase
MSAAFRFAVLWDGNDKNRRKVIFGMKGNPARDVPTPQKREKPGQRALSAEEIKELWPKWGDPELISAAAGTALRLILATCGQRVEEVLRAPWAEFDTETKQWELPAERTKKKRAHVVPLTDLALELMEGLKEHSGDDDLLFPQAANRDNPMETNSLGNAVRRFCERAKCEKFTARDLRRTAKTELSRMGVPNHIRDRIHNHKIPGVSEDVYNRYDYLSEKRAVMNRWQEFLTATLAGKPAADNVVEGDFQQRKEGEQ